jgi:hypothetical protein
MNRRLALGTGLIATLVAGGASAQEVTIGYQGLPYKASGESNTGIQVSDGVLLHVGAGAEAGYDTNVFYTNTAPIGSGLIRVMPFADLSNASRTGPVSHQLSFDFRVGLQYRHYLSDDPSVKAYDNAWLPNAGLSVGVGGGQVGFGLADTFARIEDPPYGTTVGGVTTAAGPPITRYNNQFSVEGRWSPGGGRLSATLRYTNMVDVFQGTYEYANSDTNYLMLDGAWKWLPKTAIFANVQQGYVFYLNDTLATANGKVSSYPLRATVGLRGLLTSRTSAVLSLGYTNGFYSSGPSTSGFAGNTFAELAVTVRPTDLSRVVAGYRHDFVNAVISSFSNNDSVYASYLQQIAGRLALDLSGRWTHEDFGGNFVDPAQLGRVDNLFQVGASLDYFVRNWTYLGVAYSLLADNSNISTLSYVKQQMFVRLGITY